MFRALLAILFYAFSCSVFAGTWSDLWARPDQQATQLLQNGQAAKAAQRFVNQDWKGVAQYRAGDYKKTAATFSLANTPLANYNRGNALAHLGEYKEAIKAYEKVLKVQLNDHDAKFNRDLLLKLLKQQKNKKQKQSQQTKQKPKQSKSKQQPNNNQSQKSKSEKQQKKSQAKKSQQAKAAKKPSEQPKPQKANRSPKPVKHNTQRQAQQRAAKQWLKRVPDDPGGLLRQKFLRDYLRRHSGDHS